MTGTGCCKIPTDWLEHGAEPLFSARTDLSILPQRKSNVSAMGYAVARYRFGQEGDHSSEQVVCCDPPVFAVSTWETPRAYRFDENIVDQSPAANGQTQRATPSRPANTAYICYYVVA